jgi:hypothetical protein
VRAGRSAAKAEPLNAATAVVRATIFFFIFSFPVADVFSVRMQHYLQTRFDCSAPKPEKLLRGDHTIEKREHG